jgi:nucleotide-binding universal stress UspA family protein
MRASVTLLRVVDPVTSEWSERGAMGRSQRETTQHSASAERAQGYLERLATQIRATGVEVDTLVRQGQAAKQIVSAAEDVEADVIAMSASRRALNRLLFGSTTEDVLRHSALPVLLIRSA